MLDRVLIYQKLLDICIEGGLAFSHLLLRYFAFR